MTKHTEPLHFMLDIETLGKPPGGAITQIGCVAFSPHATVLHADSMASPSEQAGGGMISSPEGYFRMNVKIPTDSCPRKEHVEFGAIDWGTLSWWLTQDPKTFDRVHRRESTDERSLSEVLYAFARWVQDWQHEWFAPGVSRRQTFVWGNSPTFDCTIMKTAFQRTARDWPFRWSAERDYRTIRAIGQEMGIDQPPFVGTPHDALDDAYHQASYAIMVLQALKNGVA